MVMRNDSKQNLRSDSAAVKKRNEHLALHKRELNQKYFMLPHKVMTLKLVLSYERIQLNLKVL